MTNPYQPYPQDQSGGYGQAPYQQGGWDPSRGGYLQGAPIGFGGAISEGLKNILTFNGRASRSAFWWYTLFLLIIGVVLGVILGASGAYSMATQYVVDVIGAALSIAVAVRRLHDSGKSGFWWLIGLIPLVGAIILIVFYCQPGTYGPNKYDR